jgi:glutamine amidotransferase
MKIAVIDYQSGNLASASRALARAAHDQGIAAEVVVTAEPEEVRRADRLVLPGQGAFADCAAGLNARPGLKQALIEGVEAGKPFLGICVGMQLMAERGLEFATTPGLGWIRGEIAEMHPEGALRLPQMGWNELRFTPGGHPVMDGLTPGDHVYFVHSFALAGADPAEVVATTEYGGDVVAIVARDNRIGTQFHPEKSQEVGQRLLANFLRWTP